jgi:hypothetical protein
MMANIDRVFIFFFVAQLFFQISLSAQPVPSDEEKIKFLVTFSNQAKVNYGDDDYYQILYFVVPERQKNPVYVRVFDPNVGGKHDEKRSVYNSKTQFSVYGGYGVHFADKIRKSGSDGDLNSGILIASKIFDASKAYDDTWYTFGPFNPSEGELQPEFGGYVFKCVVQGLSGDDGNLYKLFLSSRKDKNTAIEGGNCFYYECSFRLSDELNAVSHIYPFINQNVIKVHINVFDYDNEGTIRLVSVAKNGLTSMSDKDGEWTTVDFDVESREQNTSLDIQFVKTRIVKNNNVVVFITNQEKSRIPFFTIPIGGVPKYKPTIVVVPGN